MAEKGPETRMTPNILNLLLSLLYMRGFVHVQTDASVREIPLYHMFSNLTDALSYLGDCPGTSLISDQGKKDRPQNPSVFILPLLPTCLSTTHAQIRKSWRAAHDEIWLTTFCFKNGMGPFQRFLVFSVCLFVLVFRPHFVTWACAGSAGPAIPVPRQSGLPGLWALSTQLWVPFPGQPCSFPGCLCPSAVIWASELSTGKWSSNWLFVIWRSSKLNLTKEPRNCILPPPLFSTNWKSEAFRAFLCHTGIIWKTRSRLQCPSAPSGFLSRNVCSLSCKWWREQKVWRKGNSFKKITKATRNIRA